MNTTDTTFDPAILSGTATVTTSGANMWQTGFWRNGTFYPTIQGAADDSASDDSETSSEEDNSGGTDDDSSDNSQEETKDEKSFTQEEVNALIARETSKAQRGKLDPKELGFSSAKELQAFLDSARTQAEASKTEAEKQVEEAVKTATEQARAEVLDVAGELVLKAEFLIAAKDHNVKYPHDAYALVQDLKEWEQVDINEEGVVEGIDDTLFDVLKTSKPFLFDQPGTEDIGAGQRSQGKNNQEEIRAKFPALKASWFGGNS